jgi:hypothetical protein
MRLEREQWRVTTANIVVPACLISAALQTYSSNVTDLPH